MVKRGRTKPRRKPVVGIVGGRGKMGRLLARLFRRKGLEVRVSDLHTRLTNARLVPACDVVFFSVPLPVALRLLPRLAPLAKPGALLCDLTSVQEKTVSLLARSAPKSVGVAGVHPLFGPDVPLRGRNLVVCPARANRWLNVLQRVFKEAGLCLHVLSPRDHDRLTAVLQAGVYLDALSFARRLREAGLSLAQARRLATPNGRQLLDLVESVLGLDDWLVASIVFGNRFVTAAARHPWKSERQLLRGFRNLKEALV